jgi:hypothetical protein
VQGKTGVVVLGVVDLTAAPAVHTHSTSDVSGLAAAIADNAPVVSVQGRTGQVVVSVADLSAASVSHTHSTTDVSGLTAVANVVSVNGITGTPVVVAGQGITVSTSGSNIQIAAGDGLPQQGGNANRLLSTDGTAATWVTRYSIVDPVLVQGGGITLTRDTTSGSITIEAAGGTSGVSVGNSTPLPLGVAAAGTSSFASREDHVHKIPTISDITAAAAVHTHSTTDVSGLTAAIAANSPVSSVQGKVGTVVLSVADLTAAPAVHTHSTSDVSGLVYVSSLNGQTGSLSVVAGSNITVSTSAGSIAISGENNVVSVNGKTGVVVLNNVDVSAASTSHTHLAASVTDLTNVANVVSVNGLTGAVTISTSGGGGGSTAASIGTKSPSSNPSNDYDAGTTDVVRVDPTTGLTITGLAGGVSGVVKLLVNVSTHNVLLSSSNTNSNSTNRFLFTGSDRVLSENDSASTFYDSTSQRWRLIADEPAAPPYHWATVTATSTLNNYSPGTATVLRVVASGGNRFISGFSGGGPNKALRVINISTNSLTLYHESGSSDAANRLLLDAGTDRALQENDQAELLYDPISSRWRVTPCCGVSS